MDDTRDNQTDTRPAADARADAPSRQPWVAPMLMRHASLTALTQQYPPQLIVDPRTGELLDPNNPEHRIRIADIPGSTGFFP
ncbi:MAG: hypothetical protein ACT4PJ_08535 [Gemmatimonadaceae bacterium]